MRRVASIAIVVLLAACGSPAKDRVEPLGASVLVLGDASMSARTNDKRHEVRLTANGTVTVDGTHRATVTATGELKDPAGNLLATLRADGKLELADAAGRARKDMLATRHEISFTMQLPRRYIDDVRQVSGVRAATWANWFGGKDPKQRVEFFAAFAVDHETWFTVMDEMRVEPAVLAKWKQTPNGAILGDLLARTLQVEVGQRLTITSDIYPGEWELEVVGTYTPAHERVDRNSLVFHWDYLTNDPRGAWSENKLGWIMTRIADPTQSADIAKRIDALFEDREDRTLTMTEHAFHMAFLKVFDGMTIREDGAILADGKVLVELGGVGGMAFTGAPETRRALVMAWIVLTMLGEPALPANR